MNPNTRNWDSIRRLNPTLTYAQAREIQHKNVEYLRKLRRQRNAAKQLAWERGQKLRQLQADLTNYRNALAAMAGGHDQADKLVVVLAPMYAGKEGA